MHYEQRRGLFTRNSIDVFIEKAARDNHHRAERSGRRYVKCHAVSRPTDGCELRNEPDLEGITVTLTYAVQVLFLTGVVYEVRVAPEAGQHAVCARVEAVRLGFRFVATNGKRMH